MVVSTAEQLSDSYQLWHRFSYPTNTSSYDAVAVPSWVGDLLNSAFTIIITMALVRFWTILISLILYYYVRKMGRDTSRLDPLAAALWNKRAELADSALEIITFKETDWARPWAVFSIFLALAAWAAQVATGVLVPPRIILGEAAPVRPDAIYVPNQGVSGDQATANLFFLEVPRYMRAIGSAAANKDLRQQVSVSSPERLGETEDGDILRINYSYGATGADLGIQRYFDLTYNVTGSCITEYAWYFNNATADGVPVDIYDIPYRDPNSPMPTASLFDGRAPLATFYLGPNATKGTLDESNSTWAAMVSSISRKSFSMGTDPWYLTGPPSATTNPPYSVLPRRPAISCWEDKVWSYHGHMTTFQGLQAGALPGLNLSASLAGTLAQYLSSPTVSTVGIYLQTSALLSSTTAFGEIFDAAASSLHDDLERLIVAAYVVTVNCLTDTTLYPATTKNVPNYVLGDSGQVPQDAAGFVVFSSDVAALSTVVIIAIPTIFVGLWLVCVILLYCTSVKIVTDLDSIALQYNRKENNSSAAAPEDVENTGESQLDPKRAPNPAPNQMPLKSEETELPITEATT